MLHVVYTVLPVVMEISIPLQTSLAMHVGVQVIVFLYSPIVLPMYCCMPIAVQWAVLLVWLLKAKKGPNVEEIGIVTILVSKYVKCFTL